jgi:hypothetical protein
MTESPGSSSGSEAPEEELSEHEEEAISEESFADLAEDDSGGLTSRSSIEHTSDALYIVREANILAELEEALAKNGVELKEEDT